MAVDRIFESILASKVRLLMLAVALFLLGATGFLFVRPAYRHYWDWRATQLAEKALQALAANDLRTTTLLANQALQLSPANLHANRAMAVLETQLGDPRALLFWQAVTNLAPREQGYRLEMAEANLRFAQPAAAQIILEQIKPELGNTVAWLNTASGCAIARADFDTALGYLRRVQELAPNDEACQLNYASVAVFSLNPALQLQAVAQLERLAQKPAFAPKAWRTLAFFYRRAGDLPKSLACWDRLRQHGGISWEERAYYLDLVKAAAPGRLPALLEAFQTEAEDGDSPKAVYELALWYFRNGRARACIDLLTAANVELREPAFYCLMADALIETKEWDQLEILFHHPIVEYREYLRYALLALSEQRRGRPESQTTLWDEAVRRTQGDNTRLLILADLALKWGWESRAVEIWWQISRGQDSPELGFRYLTQYYVAKHDKRALREVLRALHRQFPQDAAVAGDLADLDMIYQDHLELAYQLAAWVYQQNPKRMAFAATYGLALLFQGRPQEAERVYASVANALVLPGPRLYYGMILAANGKFTEALQWLARVEPSRLEPEEVLWLNRTRRQAEEFSRYPIQFKWIHFNEYFQPLRRALRVLGAAFQTVATSGRGDVAGQG